MGLKEFEDILNLNFVKEDSFFSAHTKSVIIKISGSEQERQMLEESLNNIHLRLSRSADYFSGKKEYENSYEIGPMDGIGNEIVSQYCQKHGGREIKNSFKHK